MKKILTILLLVAISFTAHAQQDTDIRAVISMYKSQIDSLNTLLLEKQKQNEYLQNLINRHKCPQPQHVLKVKQTSVSVFFNINSSEIASRTDLVNVQELVDHAKRTGQTVEVTGYADSQTGSVERNQALSESRAQTVAKELVKMGLDASKIDVVGKGGVQDLMPQSHNRRVIVSTK